MNRVSKMLLSAVWLPAIWLTANVSAQVSEAVAERNHKVIATLHAEGIQIYECKVDPGQSPSEVHALTWQFREPIAALFADGKSIGRHYAGPNWDHIDGSGVTGRVVANAPGKTANDIAWLKLEATAHRGEGILAGVTTIQRVNTAGGV